jgi:hypothetical protein
MSFSRKVVGVVLSAVLLAAVPLAASGAAPERAAASETQSSLASQALQGLRAFLARFLPTAGPVGKAERLHGVPQPHLAVSCDNTSGMDPNGCPKP